MKVSALVLLILFPCLLLTVTRTVSLDGTQQYTSIQTAIDACSNGDVVEVYPGEYFEHLNTNGRSITIQSRYYITQSEDTIENTIVHASVPNSCLEVISGENVIINGFTLINNSPNEYIYNLWQCLYLLGGGIEVYNGSGIQILNCIIRNCFARMVGGVYFCGSSFYMSNTKIFNCYAAKGAGGIGIGGYNATSVIFDNVLPNSIYNNTGTYGMDIRMESVPNPISLTLHTFSVILTEPDNYFFEYVESAPLNFSVQHAYFNLINQDVYVSPNGNDANTGISPLTPFQTIAHAVKVIQSDDLYPKTIHLIPGVYNLSTAHQLFPLKLKSHTRLKGDSPDNTIMDTEQSQVGYFDQYMEHDLRFDNITFTTRAIQDFSPVLLSYCENIVLKNLNFTGYSTYDGNRFDVIRINLNHSTNILCENIVIGTYTSEDSNIGIYTLFCDDIILNNIIVNRLRSYSWSGAWSTPSGNVFLESDVTMRNSIVSNCYTYAGPSFYYSNTLVENNDKNLDLSNTLIINNYAMLNGMGTVDIHNKYQRMKLNNCTIANNYCGGSKSVLVRGDCDLNNSILYNTGNHSDLYLLNLFDGGLYTPSVSYCLLRNDFTAQNSTLVNLNNNLINYNPQFQGATNSTWSVDMPDYYKLDFSSPCINAGTPDTLGLGIPPMDLAGNYRVWDGRIDMGCYEFGSAPVSIINPEYPSLPDEIVMSIYPNPVYLSRSKGSYAFIEFTLPNKVKEPPLVEIYSIKGQKVRSIRLAQSYNDLVHKAGLSKDVKTQGILYSTVYDCKDEQGQRLASGIYIVKVKSDRRQAALKITLMN